MCSFNGASIPCTKDGGWWSASYGCYITGPIAIFNTANTGGDGFGFYECELPGGGVSILRLPDTAPPIQVDPEVLARRAIEQMGLQAIDIGIVPEPGPASVGLVGLPVWLWVDQPGAATYGPVTASATDGITTVTATAHVRELMWDMGDGATVTCRNPGTPYADRYGDSMSPDCGHRYTRSSADQPSQAYQVTATSQWEVTWTGGGQSGVIPITLSNSTPVTVGEAQVLVQ